LINTDPLSVVSFAQQNGREKSSSPTHSHYYPRSFSQCLVPTAQIGTEEVEASLRRGQPRNCHVVQTVYHFAQQPINEFHGNYEHEPMYGIVEIEVNIRHEAEHSEKLPNSPMKCGANQRRDGRLVLHDWPRRISESTTSKHGQTLSTRITSPTWHSHAFDHQSPTPIGIASLSR
jgi:hypothetical protein